MVSKEKLLWILMAVPKQKKKSELCESLCLSGTGVLKPKPYVDLKIHWTVTDEKSPDTKKP